jgi:hypothetical protein
MIMFHVVFDQQQGLTGVTKGRNGVTMHYGKVLALSLEGCKPTGRTECLAGADEWMVQR